MKGAIYHSRWSQKTPSKTDLDGGRDIRVESHHRAACRGSAKTTEDSRSG